jgi:hypothetical protein
VIVLSLIIALASPATRPEHRPREYAAIPSTSPPCTLEISPADVFALQCRQRSTLRGAVHRFKNWLSLNTKPASTLRVSPLAAPDDEYWSAFRLHMQQHFKEHGFYPVIAPRPVADVPETTGCIMVSVQYGGREYLVDLFERDSFCGAVHEGRELQRTFTQHRVFRRRDRRLEPGILRYEDFCAPQWRPLFE